MKFTVAQGLVVVALMMTATPSRARAASPLSTIEQDLKVAQKIVEEEIVEPAAQGILEKAEAAADVVGGASGAEQHENEYYCPLPWTADTSDGSPPPKIGELAELLRSAQPDEVLYQFGDSTMRQQVRRPNVQHVRDLICAQCFAPTQSCFFRLTFPRKITSRFSHTHIVCHFVLCDAKGDSRPEL